MGNTTSCCVASSPKHRRNNHSRLEPYGPEPELSREDTGCNLQHISDRENLDGKTWASLVFQPFLPPPSPLDECMGGLLCVCCLHWNHWVWGKQGFLNICAPKGPTHPIIHQQLRRCWLPSHLPSLGLDSVSPPPVFFLRHLQQKSPSNIGAGWISGAILQL